MQVIQSRLRRFGFCLRQVGRRLLLWLLADEAGEASAVDRVTVGSDAGGEDFLRRTQRTKL
ncbi:hypothetical protein Skr01_71980 [Sphaerisporangium krabiense]|nr:hypothetical protein Skr01_71980 [Sphaerisporangium krabiense]